MTTFTSASTSTDYVTGFTGIAGVSVDLASVVYSGDAAAASIVTNIDPVFGLADGILITSGDGIIPLTNTDSGYTGVNGSGSDADLEAVISTVFTGNTTTNDAASLSFSFDITDPTVNSISLNVLFGSDEYPEFSNSFVDVAGVFVNGTNYAYFGGDVNAPLSVLDANLGYFIDNTGDLLPIEYDGVSNPITVFAPVDFGTNTIKIAIADTGDSVLDSGIFVSSLGTSTSDFGGVFVVPEFDGGPTPVTFNSEFGDVAEIINTGEGSDTINAGGGDDQVDGGAGDEVIDLGDGDDFVIDAIGNNTITGGQGADIGITFSGNGQFLEDNANIEGDFYCGGFGSDIIQGGGGNDVLIGDSSAASGFGSSDTLTGGQGDDLMEGGVGADIFIFNTGDGADTIGMIDVNWSNVFASTVSGADFDSGIDAVHLSGFGYATSAEAFTFVADVGGEATFSDQGTSITFAGLTTADIAASDFVLI